MTDEEKKERARTRAREWYRANKEKARVSFLMWKAEHPAELKKRKRESYLRHREARLSRQRELMKTPEAKEKMRVRALLRKVKSPEEYCARYILGNAVKQGKIIRLPCIVCGDEKSQGHHEDYTKPLDVIWLCDKHHKEKHKTDAATNSSIQT